MVSMALLGLNVSVDRVDVPQIMEMQAVLTDRAYGMRQDRLPVDVPQRSGPPSGPGAPWLSTGN